ncbi:MAG TPA: Dyp-type peroxidase [Chloroflexota bacterium]|jgi:Dyp-type peroxidase family|nr:Dyp-type peroxidase [Chloroflexota bacterium]
MADTLDFADIQGIVTRGYGKLRAATYALLEISAGAPARAWLSALAGTITSCQADPDDVARNIAFTPSGLSKMGLTPDMLALFSAAFLDGMASTHRGRLLGDLDANAPQHWAWGSPTGAPVDLVLMLYASDEAALSTLYDAQAAAFQDAGLRLTQKLETVDLGDIEHFGFRDGVSQPVIEGIPKAAPAANVVKAGEFLLGYVNEYGLYTDRPLLPAAADPTGILPRDPAGSSAADLGRNGSYLVVRTLQQDVYGFRQFLAQTGASAPGGDTDAGLRLAAKLVGRWPSGAPLALTPEHDDPALAGANDFAYAKEDPDGLRCPVGAHIRRSHPRDSLDPNPGSDQSVAIDKRHRLIRRGREYGPPLPADDYDQPTPPCVAGVERGLHFMAVNANIARQFEFIQHTWLNNPKFAGLYDDADPLLAAHTPVGGAFTIPADPVRARITGLPRFVTVRGGAYFFLPGLRAIRYLAKVGS